MYPNFAKDQPDWAFFLLLQEWGLRIEAHSKGVSVQGMQAQLPKSLFALDCLGWSDQFITLAVVLGGLLPSTEVFSICGIGHTAFHESSRPQKLLENWQKLGGSGSINQSQSGSISLSGLGHLKKCSEPREWECHNDHRFVMGGALLTLLFPCIHLDDTHCVSKTAPGFFKQWNKK